MAVTAISEYGKLIEHRLIDASMTQAELIQKVQEQTNLYFDRSYMKKIKDGKLRPAKIVSAINDILGIEG